MLFAFVFSFYAQKFEKSLIILTSLLLLSLLTEMLVEIFKSHKINHRIIYHIYIPVEYMLLALFLSRQNVNSSLKKIIRFSIPVYFCISMFISFFFISYKDFPGTQFNIEGLFLVSFVIAVLFSLKITEGISIFRLPFFWIGSGLLLFHSGLFFFNGAYNYLIHNKTEYAAKLQTIINTNLNYLLYIFWIIGFIWAIRNRKYITQF